MTLRTGKRETRSGEAPRRRGFTLVELLLVMTLLIVVISLSGPSLSKFFRGRTLDSEARRFLTLTRYGQSRAVSEGVPMELWVDVEERSYGLQMEPGHEEEDPRAVQYTLEKELRVEVAEGNANRGLSASLNRSSGRGAGVGPGLLAGASGRRDGPMIRFLPDGSISESSVLEVRLLDRDDESLAVALAQNRLNYEVESPTNRWNRARP